MNTFFQTPTLVCSIVRSAYTRTFSTSIANKMIIEPVLCLKDNYAYLLLDEKTKEAAVVDPVEPEKVLAALEKYQDYKLTTILTTHHHRDHAGGNNKLLKKRPGLTVFGGSKSVEGVTTVLESEDQPVKVGKLVIQSLLTGGHTLDHLCYWVRDQDDTDSDSAVFTGDCLFSSGCGRFFEGTPKDMHAAFERLKRLPGKTKVYFGHEYTVANCNFALKVEPDNTQLQEKAAWARQAACTTPSTMTNELLTNPFLRVQEAIVRKAVSKKDEDISAISDIEVLGRLRAMKDNA